MIKIKIDRHIRLAIFLFTLGFLALTCLVAFQLFLNNSEKSIKAVDGNSTNNTSAYLQYAVNNSQNSDNAKKTPKTTDKTPPNPSLARGSNTNSVLAASTNIPVPSSGAYWGTTRGDPGNPPSQSITSSQRQQFITDAENQIGRKYDYDRQFFKWGDDPFAASPTPNDYLKWSSTTGGHYMHINLVAANRTSGFTSWATIANGSQDSYLHALAANIKSWGKPAFFTFQHEPESKICPGDTNSGCDTTVYYGTTGDYKAAWRHIVSLFRGDGVNNLSYAWLTGSYRWSYSSDYRYGPNNYPGSDIIDWIGVDPFNFPIPFGTSPDYAQWKELTTIISPWYSWAKNQSKPLMLGAWGVIADPNQPNRQESWLNNAHNDIKAHYPAVKALLSYDTYPPDNLADTRIFEGNQATINAYKNWGADTYFNTRNCNVSACPGYSSTPPQSGGTPGSTPGNNPTGGNSTSNNNSDSKTSDGPTQAQGSTNDSARLQNSESKTKKLTVSTPARIGVYVSTILTMLGSFGLAFKEYMAHKGRSIKLPKLKFKINFLHKNPGV